MQTAAEHRVRAAAPVATVWAECAALDRLLARAPEVVRVDPAGGGEEASFGVRLTWGRLEWTLDGTARTRERIPHERVGVEVELPNLGIELHIQISLSAAGESETNLVYAAAMTSEHPAVNRLPGVFADMVELHVRTTAEEVAATAARVHKAEEAMLKRFGAEPS